MRHTAWYLTAACVAMTGVVVWRVMTSATPMTSALMIVVAALAAGFVTWAVDRLRVQQDYLEELEDRIQVLEARERISHVATFN